MPAAGISGISQFAMRFIVAMETVTCWIIQLFTIFNVALLYRPTMYYNYEHFTSRFILF